MGRREGKKARLWLEGPMKQRMEVEDRIAAARREMLLQPDGSDDAAARGQEILRKDVKWEG